MFLSINDDIEEISDFYCPIIHVHFISFLHIYKSFILFLFDIARNVNNYYWSSSDLKFIIKKDLQRKLKNRE